MESESTGAEKDIMPFQHNEVAEYNGRHIFERWLGRDVDEASCIQRRNSEFVKFDKYRPRTSLEIARGG